MLFSRYRAAGMEGIINHIRHRLCSLSLLLSSGASCRWRALGQSGVHRPWLSSEPLTLPRNSLHLLPGSSLRDQWGYRHSLRCGLAACSHQS